jgi:hypothetical protein
MQLRGLGLLLRWRWGGLGGFWGCFYEVAEMRSGRMYPQRRRTYENGMYVINKPRLWRELCPWLKRCTYEGAANLRASILGGFWGLELFYEVPLLKFFPLLRPNLNAFLTFRWIFLSSEAKS